MTTYKSTSDGKMRWIQEAVKKPGQLHRDLHVSMEKEIPAKMMAEAAKKGGKIGQRARFAMNMKNLH